VRRACGLEQVPPNLPWPVVTLGTFDGVHIGHQQILRDTINWARDRNGTAVIVTFSRLPRRVTSDTPAPCITSLHHRLTVFERMGIDLTVVLDFTPELMRMPAEAFTETVFCGALGARGIQWGFNCRFGRGAEGDIELLRRFEKKGRFRLRQSKAVMLDGFPVSSTAIRKRILSGDLDYAARMLGRRVSLLGTVVPGDGRGDGLGFPTANLDLHHEAVPPPGIYACEALVQGRTHIAVANIGPCPTFTPPKPADAVEVHILDFDQAITGEDVEVRFIRFLREEVKFRSTDALIRQMHADVAETRRIVQSRS